MRKNSKKCILYGHLTKSIRTAIHFFNSGPFGEKGEREREGREGFGEKGKGKRGGEREREKELSKIIKNNSFM